MNTVELLLRLVISMAVVIGLAWGASKVMRSRRLGGSSAVLEVLTTTPLDRNSTVALVRATDRFYLVGSSEHGGVRLLGELDPDVCESQLLAAQEELTELDPSTGEPISTTTSPTGAPGQMSFFAALRAVATNPSRTFSRKS